MDLQFMQSYLVGRKEEMRCKGFARHHLFAEMVGDGDSYIIPRDLSSFIAICINKNL